MINLTVNGETLNSLHIRLLARNVHILVTYSNNMIVLVQHIKQQATNSYVYVTMLINRITFKLLMKMDKFELKQSHNISAETDGAAVS